MITIREMNPADIDEAVRIEEENFPEAPWSDTGFFTHLLREDALYLTAEEDGQMVGYAGMLTMAPDADITKVSVDRTRRREGIGEKLLAALKDGADERGVRHLYLEVRTGNEAAVSLYKKLGFTEVGTRRNYYTDPVEDAYVMECLLGGAE